MRTVKVAVGKVRNLPPARRALDEAFLDQIRLVDLLDSTRVFAECGGNRGKAHGAALELVDDRKQNPVVDLVKPVLVDVEGFKGLAGYLYGDASVAHHHREVAHTPQERVGNARRAA